jgi:hypothetical protein
MSETPAPEVLAAAERFSETDGQWGYESTNVVYQVGTAVYVGQSHIRYRSKEAVNLQDLYESHLIPTAHLQPMFPQHFTRAPDLLSPGLLREKA